LKAVLRGTKGRVEFGGKYEEGGLKRKWGMEPTVVVDVKEDDALLEEYELLPISDTSWNFDVFFVFREIFGPILPLVAVEDVDEAIKFLNGRYDYVSAFSIYTY
jgi:aldehyde dehydrogenase (NAD+)